MPLSNREKLEIITRAKKDGYKGDYLELFRMAEQQMRQDMPEPQFRGGGFANDINKPKKSTYVDARSGYGFPTTYEHGGPHTPDAPATVVPTFPDVDITALTDETYASLTPAQQQLYDAYITPAGVSQSIPITVGEENEVTKDIHFIDALNLAGNNPATDIINQPILNMTEKEKIIFRQKGQFRAHANSGLLGRDIYIPSRDAYMHGPNFMRNRRTLQIPEGTYFHPETNPGTEIDLNLTDPKDYEKYQAGVKAGIYIPDPYGRESEFGPGRTIHPSMYQKPQSQYLEKAFQEYAHVDPTLTGPFSMHGPGGRIITDIDRLRRTVEEGEYPDASNYQSPYDLEYYTHTAPDSNVNILANQYSMDKYDMINTKPTLNLPKKPNPLPLIQQKHGGFAAFFASDYDKYVQKKEDGGKKVEYTKPKRESGVFVSPFVQSFKTSDLQKQQDIQNMDYDFDAFAAGIADVESVGGALMINDQSSATGLYQRRFSEIKDIYPGTREEFSKDIAAQKRFFKERFDKDIMKDGIELFKEYDPQMNLSRYGLDPVKISALSNMLGRQGTRKYLGNVLRDGKSLEEVFPTKYGPNRQLGLDGKPLENKTPEEYIEQFYKVYSERAK